MKKWLGLPVVAAALLWCTQAFAGCSIGAYPFTLTNGTIADANQVMANFNQVVTGANSNCAGAGANNDITALNALSTPIAPGGGGTTTWGGGTSTGSANAQVVAALIPSTGFGLIQNYCVLFTPGFTNTGALQVNIFSTGLTNVLKQTASGLQSMIGGEVVTGQLTQVCFDGTQFQLVPQSPPVPVVRGALGGLQMSATGTNTTVSITAGAATNDTNTVYMTLGSNFTKTVSAFGAGTAGGCLDSGSIAVSTWYHVFLIFNPTTFATDILCSTSLNSPVFPSGFTLKRRIGSVLTTATPVVTGFVSVGPQFLWLSPPLDVNFVTPTTASRTLYVLSVPPGVSTTITLNIQFDTSTSGEGVYVSSPLVSDVAATDANSQCFGPASGNTCNTQITVLSNTASQVGGRASASTGTPQLAIATVGYLDTRGAFN